MSNENLIHVRLDYSEAIQAKRDVLGSEITLLKIAKQIKNSRFYRNEELELKALLYKRVRELKAYISNLQKTLPKLAIPSILKREGYKETEYRPEERKRTSNTGGTQDTSIEDQLWDIQRKLNDLQAKNF